MYPIYDLEGTPSDRPEMLGTKEKFWFRPISAEGLDNVGHLFKIGRPGTGENWAEKIAAEIAKRIGLPCAEYHFAHHQGRNGVISPLFMPQDANLVTANYLLAKIFNGYDGEKRFNQFEYRLEPVLNTINNLKIAQPMDCGKHFENFTAVEMFVGYLFFDVFIGNTDRHHENWGVIIHGEPPSFYLTPAFDHASSLGRNETEEKRQLRLTTKDQRATVEAYAARARSAFFGASGSTTPMLHREVAAYIASKNATIARYWTSAMCSVEDGEIQEMFNKVPSTLITPSAIDFAMRMLRYNRDVLREVTNAS